jgi:signal peptidase I
MKCIKVGEVIYQVFVCHSTSMLTTLKPGDLVYIVPVLNFQDIHVGDVIAFYEPCTVDRELVIVHRVQASSESGLRTQGDACLSPDPSVVMPHNVIGRVFFIERQNKLHYIRGGKVGQLWALLMRLRRQLVLISKSFYEGVQRNGIVSNLWHPAIEVVICVTQDAIVIKCMHRNKTVAKWCPDSGVFWTQKPYDLVIEPPANLVHLDINDTKVR